MSDDDAPVSSSKTKKRRRRLSDAEVEEEAGRLESLLSASETISNDGNNNLNSSKVEEEEEKYRSLFNKYYDVLIPPRLQMERWLSLDKNVRKIIALAIQDKTKLQFQRLAKKKKFAVFECPDNLIEFVLIPGGSFMMGLSDELEELLFNLIVDSFDDDNNMENSTYEEVMETDNGSILKSVPHMRPTKDVVVAPFLLATTPLLYRQVKTYLPNSTPPTERPYDEDENDDSGDDNNNDDDNCGEEKQDYLGMNLSEKEIRSILLDHRFRLPSEAEWEYAAREGGKDNILFPFGEMRIPTEDDLEYCFHNSSKKSGQHRPNKLNLRGLGSFFELCADIWRDDLTDTPTDGSPQQTSTTITPIRVVRGGAIGSWQDCGEWQNMLVYARHPHRSNHPVSVRLAMSVG